MFNKEAKIYDLFYKDKDYEGEVDEITPLLSGKSIVDIGSGTGSHDKVFVEKGFTVLGIEPCKEMAQHALGKDLSVRSDFKTDERFDNAVLLFDVFNFLDDPNLILKEISNLVKSEGNLVFDTWDSLSPTKSFGVSKRNGIIRFAYKYLKKQFVWVHFLYIPHFIYQRHKLQIYSDKEIIQITTKNGFKYIDKVGKWWRFKKV